MHGAVYREYLLNSSASLCGEEGVAFRFTWIKFQEPPVKVKEVEVVQISPGCFQLSDILWNERIRVSELPHRSTIDETSGIIHAQIFQLRSIVEKSACISTCKSLASFFFATTALKKQRSKYLVMISVLYSNFEAVHSSIESNALDFEFNILSRTKGHLRVYSDAAFKNRPTKHSQIGFCIILDIDGDHFNIALWPSCRAPFIVCDGADETFGSWRWSNIHWKFLKR